MYPSPYFSFHLWKTVIELAQERLLVGLINISYILLPLGLLATIFYIFESRSNLLTAWFVATQVWCGHGKTCNIAIINSFWSNVARHVARFLLPVFPYLNLSGWEKKKKQTNKKKNTYTHTHTHKNKIQIRLKSTLPLQEKWFWKITVTQRQNVQRSNLHWKNNLKCPSPKFFYFLIWNYTLLK